MKDKLFCLGHLFGWWFEGTDLSKAPPERIKKLMVTAKKCGFGNWKDIPNLVKNRAHNKKEREVI